jgi:hypothetical protein
MLFAAAGFTFSGKSQAIVTSGKPGVPAGFKSRIGGKESLVMLECGFCKRSFDIVEDYIYHEGQAFHPQGLADDGTVQCCPTVRELQEGQEA